MDDDITIVVVRRNWLCSLMRVELVAAGIAATRWPHDPRLVKRLIIMLEDWAAQPQASIPEGSRSKAAAKASYWLLSNPRLRACDIAQTHLAATWERMARHEWVLAVADTTSFNHTTHPDTEGTGPIGQGNGSAQGFFLHSVLAFSEQGAALGVLHAHTWAREMKAPSIRERLAQKNRKALDQRKSHRWTAAYEAILAQQREAQARYPAGELPRLVLVADRESDIYKLFVSNITHDSHCAVLVRALHARRLHEKGKIVWEHLEARPELARIELVVPAQGTCQERCANLALRCARVKLGVPRNKARFFGASEPLELWAILKRWRSTPSPGASRCIGNCSRASRAPTRPRCKDNCADMRGAGASKCSTARSRAAARAKRGGSAVWRNSNAR